MVGTQLFKLRGTSMLLYLPKRQFLEPWNLCYDLFAVPINLNPSRMKNQEEHTGCSADDVGVNRLDVKTTHTECYTVHCAIASAPIKNQLRTTPTGIKPNAAQQCVLANQHPPNDYNPMRCNRRNVGQPASDHETTRPLCFLRLASFLAPQGQI